MAALMVAPALPVETPSLRDQITDAEDALDFALLVLSNAAHRVLAAEDALADLISVKDDA